MKLDVKLLPVVGMFLLSMFFVPQFALAEPKAGQVENEKDNTTNPTDDLTLNGQFETLSRVSTAYNEKGIAYRVIRFEQIQELQKNMNDSLQLYYKQDHTHDAEISDLQTQLELQTSEVDSIKGQLENALLTVNSVKLLGKYISLSAYKTTMWLIIFVLTVLLVIGFLMFKRGHVQVVETKKSLKELQEEFENSRKNALVREQKLARELMDVKIKNNLI